MKANWLRYLLFGMGFGLMACGASTAVPTATPLPHPPTPTTPATITQPAPTPTTPPATQEPTAVPQPTLIPLPTAAPTLVPTPTRPSPLPPPTSTLSPTPDVLYFRTNVTTADPGQLIQLEWASVGATKATLGHMFDGRMTVTEWDLPPTGVYAYPIPTYQRNQIIFFLSVEDSLGQWDSAGFTLLLTCPDAWFFVPAPDSCPTGPARLSAGAEQQFEHGWMLWEAAEQRLYILFDSGSPRWQVVSDSWQEGELICQIDPVPAGLIHPTRGFGKAWCNELGVRERLGWAVGEEVGGYETAVQSTALDRYNTLYVRAADGGVWQLLPERSGWEKLGRPE